MVWVRATVSVTQDEKKIPLCSWVLEHCKHIKHGYICKGHGWDWTTVHPVYYEDILLKKKV